MRWRGTELLPTELADCVYAGLVEPEMPALKQLRHTPCGSSVCNRQPTLRVQAHLVEATGSLTEEGRQATLCFVAYLAVRGLG